jgi:hypothetical protein
MLVIDSDKSAGEQIQLAYARRPMLDIPSGPGCLPKRAAYAARHFLIPASKIFPTIPRSDWIPMIRDGQGDFLSDRRKNILPPHDQGQTNYCWAHGSVRALEVLRVWEGQRPVILSAESVAVPLTGGRNRGGYPDEAVQQLHDYGACEQTYWPNNSRDERTAKKGWIDNRLLFQIINWLDVIGWDLQITLALHRIPVAIGLGWWGHLVCQLDPVEIDSKTVGIGIDNSWGSDWGENGYGVLTERRGTADLGAFAPLSATFSGTLAGRYQNTN